MSLSAKCLLQELVRIASVNPLLTADPQFADGEARITDYLQAFVERYGWPWLRQTVHPRRDNLVAIIPASDDRSPAAPLLWECHQDTVGIAGMSIDPFAAEENSGRIWGRGACDVKGSLAAMLTALARIHEDKVELPQPIVLALTINEECGFTGVKSLCRMWDSEADATAEASQVSGPLSLAQLRELRPTRAIVAEPTNLDVVVAHKGSVRWRCHTHGRAAHTSQPEQGSSAISAMVAVIRAIERYQTEVLDHADVDPLCGGPTVCVSTIQGGTGVNTVPDHAVIDIDRRLAPAESPADAYRQLVDWIEVNANNLPTGTRIEHDPPSSESAGLSGGDDRRWAQQIAKLTTATQPSTPSRLIGVPFGTDAWALASIGISTVVFGPGSIDQAHTADEWIDIAELERATEVFYQIAVSR